MTGLAAKDANYLYVSSRNQNSTYRYVAPGITSRYTYTQYAGGSQTRDIAITPEGHIWVATDWSSIPLRLYNTSNQMIDHIDNSLIPAARGVTIDGDGYLWVSDIQNDLIYKLDLTEGVGGSSGPGAVPSLAVSANPFSSSVTLTGTGFGEQAAVTIYSLGGRLLVDAPFNGSYLFGGSEEVSRGVYLARVRDAEGTEAVLKLTCVD